ncbi:MAG TPA: cell envelope integrity protein CreD [Rhodocyclaceae bacterium]
MQKQLFWKCLSLFVLGLMLLIPLGMIESTVAERSHFREEAVNQVAANSARAQTLIGPLLVLPVFEEYDEEISEGEGEARRTRLVRRTRNRDVFVFPRKLTLEGGLNVEQRAYGLHQVAVFDLKGQLSGQFDPPAESDLPKPGRNGAVRWGAPRLVLGLSDPRGLISEPKIKLGGSDLSPARGTGLGGMKNGFQAAIPHAVAGLTQSLPFRIELRLAGTESFGLVPLADQTVASLSSNWAHPSFGGGFLPRERQVDEQGFRATWSVSALAANVQRDILNQPGRANEATPSSGSVEEQNSFRVRLIDPVDIYRLSLRATKYGVLFVVLTFAAFFMFENLRSLPIHPVQYGLVGLALAIFFLLLLSLSEHVGFAWAYLVAALASSGLITAYLAAVLRGWKPALAFGSGLGLLLGALFGVLLSEQNALLLGSLLLFAALAALMLGTRSIDWYRLKPALQANAEA